MLFLFALACAPIPNAEASTTQEQRVSMAEVVRLHMSDHLARALSASNAVMMGNAEQAKSDLSWMGGHEEPNPLAAGFPELEQLHDAGKKGSQGTTITDYGVAVGEMGAACASCHQTVMASLSPVVATKPTSKGHAEIGSWTVSALWTGLVSNSPSAWSAGAEALAASPTEAKGYGAKKGEAAQAAIDALHAAGKAASAADDRAERAAVYGQVIGACGSCHIQALPQR